MRQYWAKERQLREANSDPGLIGLFLRFLDAAGISRSDLVFTVCIHESGDVAAACRFWLEVTKASPRPPSEDRRLGAGGHDNRDGRRGTGLEPLFLVSVAPGEGFEPSLSGPKPLVLPARRSGIADDYCTGNDALAARSRSRGAEQWRAEHGRRADGFPQVYPSSRTVRDSSGDPRLPKSPGLDGALACPDIPRVDGAFTWGL